MATRKEKECEEIFNKIVKSLKEYSTERCYNINNKHIKVKILCFLKTHRPVKLVDFEYGMSHAHKKDHRLIIREENDHSKVREFGRNTHNNSWYCSNLVNRIKCSSTALKIRYGIVFAPISHTDMCQPKEYSVVMEIQELLKEGIATRSTSSKYRLNKSLYTIMAARNEIECKELFDKIVKSFKQYSTEDCNINEEPIKSEILNLLKIHRPVKLVDYEYGLSRALKENRRLIIREEDDQTKVREFAYYGSQKYAKWCCTSRAGCSTVEIKYGIVFAPLHHGEMCHPKDYSFVMKMQDSFKQWKTKWQLSKFSNDNHTKNNATSESLNITDVSEDVNEKTFNDSESTMTNTVAPTNLTLQSNNEFNFLSSLLTNTNTNFGCIQYISATNSSHLKRVNNDYVRRQEDVGNHVIVKCRKFENVEEDDDCIIIEERPKNNTIFLNDPFEIQFSFEGPSSKMLKDVCEKLKINYNKEAYKLWSSIEIEQIPTIALNLKLHELKTKNIFECFSLLFTGTTEQYFQIQHVINEAFRDKLVLIGKMSQQKIDQLFFSSTVSDEHLTFIPNFLNCRIAIYKKSKLSRYGNWDSECDILTLVLASFNGFYSIALNL